MEQVAIRSPRYVGWPEPDLHLIRRITREGRGLVDLWEASSFRFETNKARTAEVIATLFPGDPFLCSAWTRHRFDPRPKSRWYTLRNSQFTLPNPTPPKQPAT